MVRKMNGDLQVSIADHMQTLKEIKITMNGEFRGENATAGSGKTVITFTLPEGAMAEKAVTVKLKNQTN
jgi:hypothetical protein